MITDGVDVVALAFAAPSLFLVDTYPLLDELVLCIPVADVPFELMTVTPVPVLLSHGTAAALTTALPDVLLVLVELFVLVLLDELFVL